MSDKVYKIRRRTDGKYSNGGRYPKFTKNGKTWNRLSDVVSHLAMLYDNSIERHPDGTPVSFDFNKIYNFNYDSCEIIELEFNTAPKCSIREFLDARYNEHLTSEEALNKPL